MWLKNNPGATGGGVRAGDMCARIQALPGSPSTPDLNRPQGRDVQKFHAPPQTNDMYRTYGFQMPLFTHPVPTLEIYKAILTAPRETAGQPSLAAGPELWPRIARAHTMRTKRRALRAYLRQDRFALRSETRTFDIMDTLYILASSPYIL